jgi:plasmid stabilization system protein ParE
LARRKIAVRFTRRARERLASIRLYLLERNPPAAARVLSQILKTTSLLGDFPELGRKTGTQDILEIVVPRYGYVVAYRIDASGRSISILGVFHPAQGSRDV